MPAEQKKRFVTKGGSEVVEHEYIDSRYAVLPGPIIARISAHIETHIGPIAFVQHELESRAVHIDVHWVNPSAKRPFYTLVTSGMSAKRMNCPDEAEDMAFAELMLCLPADWPISSADLNKPENAWPVFMLRRLAALPHETGAWLKPGDTLPNGRDAAPYTPDTEYCCLYLRQPTLFASTFRKLDFGQGRVINFYALLPIFYEEMVLKLESGAQALEERFAEINLCEIVKRERTNVARDFC